MTIGDRIKQRRLELGLSADELGRKINKNRATIYRYESNDIENLPTTVIPLLAKALETTPAYIMGWKMMDDKEIADVIHENMQTNISIEPEFPLNIRSAARDMMELSEADQELAINMIRSLARKGRKGE